MQEEIDYIHKNELEISVDKIKNSINERSIEKFSQNVV